MSNPWDVFQSLLPKQPLLIGEALTTYQDGTVALAVPNGQVRVLSGGISVNTGTKYYFRNGRLEGEAPNNPVIEVTIY